MTPAPSDEESAVERAEVLIDRVQEEAEVLARRALAVTVEFAQDVWAEAQSLRGSRGSPQQ